MLLPSPHEVRATFSALAASDAEAAVAYLHDLGTSSGYIKTEAIAENICWTAEGPYGELECTINTSKPEKDPRAIAAAAAAMHGEVQPDPDARHDLHQSEAECVPLSDTTDRNPIHPATEGEPPHHVSSREPQCDLCWENEEFPGSPEHPAKPGLRIAAITLAGERWGLQYSPYAYFTEHCIALSERHRPMVIDEACFERLLDFADIFPFYFIGSNADLPIVGGSILSHDHFQGGRHVFPLMKALVERSVRLEGFPEVQCGIVTWPASVLRLVSEDRTALAQAATSILNAWKTFSNEACGIIAADAAPHNTLNPIVRKAGSAYIMDLVLRNNRTDTEHPWGIFHPGESLHHIKKENIGLIEIMGLAILPGRLAEELPLVQSELIEAARQGLPPAEVAARLASQPKTAPHATWAADIYTRRAAEFTEAAKITLHPVIQDEVARVFASILETTGVFKRNAIGNAGWDSFIASLPQA